VWDRRVLAWAQELAAQVRVLGVAWDRESRDGQAEKVFLLAAGMVMSEQEVLALCHFPFPLALLWDCKVVCVKGSEV